MLTSASPAAVAALRRMNMEIDARHTLPAIHVPTLVLCRAGDGDDPDREARYIADRIPGAEFLELPGRGPRWYFVDPEQIAREVKRFLSGIWERGEWDVLEPDRVLATVLFTDIVGSTEKAVRARRPGMARAPRAPPRGHPSTARPLITGRSLTPPVMASSPASTGRPERSAAPARSPRQ